MKNKLEIGMYVRTRYGIAKVVKFSDIIDDRGCYLDRNIMSCNPENWEDFCTVHDIVGEPSFEIIDVIEQGDLVEIKSKYCEDDVYRVNCKCDDVIGLDCFQDGTMYVDNTDIKRVLTKEQYKAMCYEVKK